MAFGDFVDKFGSDDLAGPMSARVDIDQGLIFVSNSTGVKTFNLAPPYDFVDISWAMTSVVCVAVGDSRMFTIRATGALYSHSKYSPYTYITTSANPGFPYGVVVDDYVYVGDYDNAAAVRIYNKSDLSFIASFAPYGAADHQLKYCTALDVDNTRIYAASYTDRYLKVYDKASPYSFVMKVNLGFSALGVAVDDNYVYVAGYYDLIRVYDKATLDLVMELGAGGYGSADGQFGTSVRHMDVSQGLLYVADPGNNRIQIFDVGSGGSSSSRRRRVHHMMQSRR